MNHIVCEWPESHCVCRLVVGVIVDVQLLWCTVVVVYGCRGVRLSWCTVVVVYGGPNQIGRYIL